MLTDKTGKKNSFKKERKNKKTWVERSKPRQRSQKYNH